MKLPVILLTVSLLLPCLCSSAQDQQAVISGITAASSGVKRLTCKFTQVKTSELLEEIVSSSGEMEYRSDGSLLWRYLAPKRYQLAVTPEKIVITTEAGSKILPFADNPMMAAAREVMVSMMSGQVDKLDSEFDISAGLGDDGAVVTLIPRKRQLHKIVVKIRLQFDDSDWSLSSAAITYSNGYVTTITFKDKKITR